MYMRRWIGLLVVAILLVFTLQPAGGEVEAASLSQIEKQIKAAKEEAKAAEKKAANLQRQADNVEHKKGDIAVMKTDVQNSIKSIMAELDNVVINKEKKQVEVNTKEDELRQTAEELVQTEERVAARDELLQSRMRLMYTNGFVSYMDVLLSATSFTDFIDRFDALQSILNQDRDILAEYKKDKELVEVKKAEVEKSLAAVKVMYEKLAEYETHLVQKEKEKEVMIASYTKEMKQLDSELEQLEDISEEQEKILMALAAKVAKLNKAKNRIKNPYTGGKLGMPIQDNYRISSTFGTRVHPITGKRHTHTGIDFASPQGTDIFAAEAGVVITSKRTSGYGNCIIIDHGNGLWTLYGHIRNGGLLVKEGQSVKKGQKIAEVGSTGNSTGPHLHFEVRKNETAVNPGGYLK